MPILPKVPQDLSLAPVAVALDQSLSLLRDRSPKQIAYELELELNKPERLHTAAERADRVLEAAIRHVDLHGWTIQLTEDHTRIRLSGGSVTLDLGLGANLTRFIESGSNS